MDSLVLKDPKANEVPREHLAEREAVDLQDLLEIRVHKENQDREELMDEMDRKGNEDQQDPKDHQDHRVPQYLQGVMENLAE
jgi:hypothetical protein